MSSVCFSFVCSEKRLRASTQDMRLFSRSHQQEIEIILLLRRSVAEVDVDVTARAAGTFLCVNKKITRSGKIVVRRPRENLSTKEEYVHVQLKSNVANGRRDAKWREREREKENTYSLLSFRLCLA